MPDLLTVRRRLEESGAKRPGHLVAFHRCDGSLHFLDLSRGGGAAPVVGEGAEVWRDLPDFLESVVLRPPAAQGASRERRV